MISGEQLKREGRKQFCIHGHDTYVCGRYDDGSCTKCATNRTIKWTMSRLEHCKIIHKRWARKNPEKCRLKTRRWRENNPEQFRSQSQKACAKRRALSRNATIGDLTEIAKVYSRAQELRNLRFNVQVDHITPLSKGGAHEPSNLQILYAYENMRKGNSLTYIPEVIFT